MPGKELGDCCLLTGKGRRRIGGRWWGQVKLGGGGGCLTCHVMPHMQDPEALSEELVQPCTGCCQKCFAMFLLAVFASKYVCGK